MTHRGHVMLVPTTTRNRKSAWTLYVHMQRITVSHMLQERPIV